MRVTYVVPALKDPSGWRSMSVGIINAMRREGGVEATVVVSAEDSARGRELLTGVHQIVVPHTQAFLPSSLRGWPHGAATWWRLRGFRSRPVADLVHSLEAYPTGLVGSWLAKRRCPHVISAAGTYAVRWAQTRERRRYERVLEQASAVLPISNGTAALMQQHFPGSLARTTVEVVLLGTAYHERVPRATALERKPDTPPIVLSVGAIKRRKGLAASLLAFKAVRQQIPDAEYHIVGQVDQPSYQWELERLIDQEVIAGVRFLGRVTDHELQEAYRRSSVFLLTPEQHGLAFEGFGLVYVEAGAYGLPVVASETGGVPDAVRDGVTGFLVPPGDANAIAARLLQVLGDSALAQRMGAANREWAETLTWSRFAASQRAVYERVVAGWRA